MAWQMISTLDKDMNSSDGHSGGVWGTKMRQGR